MKQFKQAWRVLAVGLISSLLLASCGGGGQDAPAASAAAAGNKDGGVTEITIWHAMQGANGNSFNEIVEGFNNSVGKEKKIHATAVFQGTEITSKLKIAAKESDRKNMPDITQTVGLDIPTVSKIPGLVKASDQLKTDTSVKAEDFYPALLRAFTYKNELIGLPISTSTILLYYNKTLLDQAGIKEAPKTLEELATAVEKLTEKKDGQVTRYGLNLKVGRYALVNFIVSQKPEAFVGNEEGGRSGDMTKVTMDQDGTLKAFLTAWNKIIQTGGYKPTEDNINEEFATGANAMAIMSSSRIGTIQKLVAKNFEMGVAFLPKVNAADTSGASVGGSCLCMYDNKNDQKKAAAWEFVKYATSPEVQAKWSQSTGYLPVHTQTENLPDMKAFYEKNPAFLVPLEQMKQSNPNAQEPFDMVGWKVDGKIADIMLQFAQGKLDPDSTEKELVQAYNSALDEYYRGNR